jgi:transketolase
MAARSNNLGNLVAFVDRNRQLMTSFAEERVVFEPYPDKWAAFGWNVVTLDGHNMAELVDALDALPASDSNRPTVIICETVKGKGVDFMERNLAWHAGSLGAADLDRAVAALEASREKESV